MTLMQQCNIELENDSLQTLVRFLVYTNHNAPLLTKLLQRMQSDKDVPITHKECVALTLVIARRLEFKHRELLRAASPLYHSESYLQTNSETLNSVSFVIQFAITVVQKSCWKV